MAGQGLKTWKEKKKMTTEVKLTSVKNEAERKVRFVGLAPVMFDRYAGDNNTKLSPEQKLYLSPGKNPIIGLPALNLMSLLSAHNTNSAPKRLRDPRKYKAICNACASFVSIGPDFIPFLRDGKPIEFGGFGANETDEKSGVFIHRAVARLEKGIPNPKERPVLPLPWSLEFDFKLLANKEIKEQEILNLLTEAGLAIGIGTYRGVFGKYSIDKWE